MDHDLPRKRKQVPEDAQDIEHAVDNSEHHVTSPRCSHCKRPRLRRHSQPAQSMKKGLTSARPPRPGNDIEDHGVVKNSTPGPVTGSFLNLRRRPSPVIVDSSAASDLPLPIDVIMANVPSTYPYVSRSTLKELDLDVILQNPQLRHDLMFDCGLQFRPTRDRHRKQLCEAYWGALVREVEIGCTCFSVDKHGIPLATPTCLCSQIPTPPPNPIVGFTHSLQVITVRMPSRIRPLLSEFLEVLLLVIQPLESISGMSYVNTDLFQAQREEHSVQANYIRSIFDPALIEQELEHDIFDLSVLLRVIGTTLKGHCAPMRDNAVENMIHAAETCKPGGRGTKADAVNAVRACLEILELVQLDIANHQLQRLRVSVSRTSAAVELEKFRENFNAKSDGCHITRQWLKSSVISLSARVSPLPRPFSGNIGFRSIGHNRQIYLSVLKGMTDLVFHPPPVTSLPETLYLDQARLRSLSKDLGDIAVSYMLLLLFRQLLCSPDLEKASSTPPVKLDDTVLLKLKNEILAINSSRLSHLLLTSPKQVTDDSIESIALHIAKRVQEFRSDSDSYSSLVSPTFLEDSCSSSPHSLGSPPNKRIVNVARRWIRDNINFHSSFFSVIYNRLHEVVFTGVISQAYPVRQYTTGQLFSSAIESSAPSCHGDQSHTLPLLSGMEPLSDEIRALTDKISRMTVLHLNVYLPIYEGNDFLET